MAKAFLRGDTLGVADTDSRLFQVMIHSYHDVNYTTANYQLEHLSAGQREALGKPEWRNRILAYNVISKRFPPFIHFAGPKYEMSDRWENIWWNADQAGSDSIEAMHFMEMLLAEAPGTASRYGASTMEGERLSYKKLCGQYAEYV